MSENNNSKKSDGEHQRNINRQFGKFIAVPLLAIIGIAVIGSVVGEHAPASKVAALPIADVKTQARTISYDSLARSPTSYAAQIVEFRGKVIQATQDGRDYVLRINVSQDRHGFWTDTLFVTYRASSDSEPRILENDIVRLWGEFIGIKSYKAVLGQTIQIPYVAAREIDR